MATGFVLNIPNEMLRRLDEADRKIEQLETTSNKAADAVVQSFLRMKNAGVDAFISSLNDANRALAAFNNVRPQNNGIQAVAAQATNSADEVHLLIASIYELIDLVGNGKGSKLKLIASNDDSFKRIADLKAEIKEINAELDRGGTKETGAITKDRQDQLRNTREALKEELKWLEAGDVKRADMIEQRIRRAERAADAEIREAKRSYTEQAKAYQVLNEKLNSTFEGAIAFSQSAKTENRHAQAIEYLIAARKQLSTADSEYAAKLNTINVAIQEHQRFLKDATLTDQQRADAAAAAAEKVVQAVARERAAYEARKKAVLDQWYSSSDTRALSFNANAKNLDELTQSIKYMEAARNKLKITDDNYEARLRSLNEAIRLSQKVLKDATLTEEERAAAARKTEDALRKRQAAEQFADASSTPEKALAFSQNAQNINQQLEAIKALQIARDNLTNTDAQYENRVAALNAEIRRQQTEVDRLRGKSEELHKSHRNLMDISGQLARKLALVFSVSQVTGYISKMMQVRGELELQQRSLQAILQNKEEANKLWDKTVALAVKSPFQIKELVTYTKQLAAYRVESSKLYDTTKMLADISAGLGVDMQRLILAYGQVKAANYLRGTELRQFSEAGINILGELAKYFSELEGSTVSVGEVFDRVSRRMVRFEDVEEIFKRLTSAGGTFYRMQEIQAETLRGQISNLKDSLTVMFNEIGMANEGPLKSAVSVTRAIVENWETVATALKAVIALMAIYQVQVMTTARVNLVLAQRYNIVNSATVQQLTLSQLLQVSSKRLIASLKTVGGTFAKAFTMNPYILAVVGLVAAITSLVRWGKRLQDNAIEVANAHDEEIAKVKSLTKEYYNLQRAKDAGDPLVLQSGKADKDAKTTLANLQQLAAEQGMITVDVGLEASSEEIAKAIATIEEQLIYKAAFGKALALQIQNQFDAVEWGGVLGDNLMTDLEQLQSAYSAFDEILSTRLTAAQNEIAANYEKLTAAARNYYAELNAGQKPNETEQEYMERRIKLLGKINAEMSLQDPYTRNTTYILRNYRSILDAEDQLGVLTRKREEVTKELAKAVEEVKEKMSIDEDTILTELQKQAIVAEITAMPEFSKFGSAVEEYVRTNLAEGFQVPLLFTPKSDAQADEEWIKNTTTAVAKINKRIQAKAEEEGIKIGLLPTPQKGSTKEEFEALIQPFLTDAARKYVKGQSMYNEADITRTKILKDEEVAISALINKSVKKTNTDEGANDVLGEQLRLLKGIVDKSEELSKILPQQKVAEALQGLYGAEWSKHLQTLGVDLDAFIASYFENSENTVLGVYDNIRKATKDQIEQARVDVATTEFTIDLQVDAQEQSLEALKKSFDEKFEEYEVWLDLQKLGFSPDMARSLFGLDSLSLGQLRAEIEESKGEFDALSDAGKQAYAEYLKEVDELERKAQSNRVIEYLEYSRKAIGERAKIKLEELQHLQTIEQTFVAKEGASDAEARLIEEQKAKAIEGVRATALSKMQAYDWEEFQQTETFISLMGDLEHASDEALASMIEQLESFREQWADMPVSEIKEIVNLINKLEEAQLENANPFSQVRELRQQLAEDGRSQADAERDLIAANAQMAIYDKELQTLDAINQARREGATNEELIAVFGQDYADTIEGGEPMLQARTNHLKKQKEAVAAIASNSKKQLTGQQTLAKLYQKQADAYRDLLSMAQDLYGAFEDIFDAAGGNGDGIGKAFADMGMNMMTTVLNTLALQAQLKSATFDAGTFGEALNAAMGPIGWIVMAVQLLAAVLSAAFKAYDQGLENQIERISEQVEKLEKQYERLEESISNAFQTSKLQSYAHQLESTAKARIAAINSMIALEQDKKSVDQDRIDDWKNQIDDLKDSLQDALRDAVSTATAGILDDALSAAGDFVDAWYDSFQEVGDGLSGLEDNFNEMLVNIVKRQATMQIAGDFIERWQNYLKSYVNEDDLTLTTQEAQQWAKQVRDELPNLSNALKGWFEALGDTLESTSDTGGLTGLQKGISSITEETAQILEAYLNSVRFYVADSNAKLAQLVATWANPEIENPMLTNLKIIAKQTTDIHTLLESLTAPHPTESGRGLKVII